jgi:hypothetical protein
MCLLHFVVIEVTLVCTSTMYQQNRKCRCVNITQECESRIETRLSRKY